VPRGDSVFLPSGRDFARPRVSAKSGACACDTTGIPSKKRERSRRMPNVHLEVTHLQEVWRFERARVSNCCSAMRRVDNGAVPRDQARSGAGAEHDQAESGHIITTTTGSRFSSLREPFLQHIRHDFKSSEYLVTRRGAAGTTGDESVINAAD
jgi:hypothetical protein